MIPNVSRGEGMVPLVQYLASTDVLADDQRRALHTDPHLVAGSPLLMAEFNGRTLASEDALQIALALDDSKRSMGVEVSGGHVWHCSLELAPADGVRTDQEWAEWSIEFMQGMEFVDAEGRLDVPFAVIRHGLSGKDGEGQDHVHVVASVVREDGTRASTWHDFQRAQDVCRTIEERHDLVRVAAGFGARGVTHGERTAAVVRGLDEPEHVTLSRHVRSAWAMSQTEGEFVRRLRSEGVQVKPRHWSKDGTRAGGYVVSMDPKEGHKRREYSGTRLANDLGLKVLRNAWDESPEAKRDAHREWVNAERDVPVEFPRDERVPVPQSVLIADFIQDLENERQRMEKVPFEDHEQWRRYAAFGAGTWASWSHVMEGPEGGPMRRVSDTLARVAQVSRSNYRPAPPRRHPALVGEVMDAFRRVSRGGARELLSEMSKLAASVRRYVQARNDVSKSEAITEAAKRDIRQLTVDMKELTRGLGADVPEDPKPSEEITMRGHDQAQEEALEAARRVRATSVSVVDQVRRKDAEELSYAERSRLSGEGRRRSMGM